MSLKLSKRLQAVKPSATFAMAAEAAALRKQGFTNVSYLAGHFSHWRSAGLREER